MSPFVNDCANFVASWLYAASWQLALFIALVALAAWGLRRASPRLRYGLWVLVLVKALLPTTLGGAWSVGSWGVTPVRQSVPAADQALAVGEAPTAIPLEPIPVEGRESTGQPTFGARTVIVAVWLFGVVGVGAVVAVSYTRLRRAARALPAADEGPLRVALEEAALRVGLADADSVDLRVADRPTGPFLFGVRRPTIVLPAELAEQLEAEELRGVLAHELMHWRRRDTWVGWVQALVQALFWFHPLVWWAAARLRDEREKSCDDAVLRHTASDSSSYGEAIVRSLTIGRGRPIGLSNNPPLAAAGLVGVFQRGALLQQRLEDVMNFDPNRGRFGWPSVAALALFAAMFLPMASRGAAEADAKASSVSTEESRESRTRYPVVVATSPKIGASDVDPGLKEIRVTFDRDMGKGMSWTGGGEDFPTSDDSQKARWVDDRTCVLPVRLKRGKFYRVGINSKSFQNFKSADGVPAEHRVISFATEGAKRSAQRKARAPKIVKLEPAEGATDVDPSRKTISVTFDTRMGGGMSWTRAEGVFPGIKKPAWWTKDGRTCTMPVELQPTGNYALGLNASHAVNFQSKWGVPIEPVVWSFSTAGE